MVLADWLSLQWNSIPSLIFVLFALALLISASGYLRMVYFISIGYAFSITGMTLITAFVMRENLTLVSVLQSIGLLIWSIRLGVFLIERELKPAYQAQMKSTYERTNALPLFVKFMIWISVSLLYVAMFSPNLFHIYSPVNNDSVLAVGTQWLGLLIMAAGLGIETLADKQKSDFKATNPKDFCAVGLYRWVRCPNYLGEILFWVGNWIAGVAVYTTLIQWVISLIGLVCITLIMMGSTKRLEHSQESRYGQQEAFQNYIQTVPVLFPFVPVYTLKNIRVYIE